MTARFLMGAILEVYQAPSGLYGFTCYKDIGILRVYNGRPIYESEPEALREAKLYYFLSKVRFNIESIEYATDFATDRVLAQSDPSLKELGELDEACRIYPEADRAKIRKLVWEHGRHRIMSQQLKCLDGREIQVAVSFELIKVDEKTALIIERIEG